MNKDKRKLWYFGLEPLKTRYTWQLCHEWMPETFKQFDIDYVNVEGDFDPDEEIKVGAVLDAVGRGKYSLTQCAWFLEQLRLDKVKDGDIIFLQDFWTPGVEGIFYALDLYGYKDIKIYTMLHAQSVDEYDFTYPMREWMRPYELGLDKRLTGIFVGSTIHKEQLRAAGFNAPIHVVSLPIHKQKTIDVLPNYKDLEKKNVIVYSSRLDKEKNPFFMMEVAKAFLTTHPDYEWHFTTSGASVRSMLPGVVDAMYKLADEQPRFKILTGLTKEEYYTELATCKVQFNSSLQDYVSWTVIESTIFGADIVFPDFRSFPEFIDEDRLYKPFDVASALMVLHNTLNNTRTHDYIGDISDIGRQMEGYIMSTDYADGELNIWHEAEYCKHLIKNK
jgi:glycosyltransferase involved in cell wall biosynthesis